MRIALAVVGVVVGVGVVSPAASMLAPRVVGGAVPTRIEDLVSYLGLPKDGLPGVQSGASPFLPGSPEQIAALKELSALSLGIGLAAGVLTYVLGGRLFG